MNLTGAFLLTKAAMRAMRQEGGGAIVHIASRMAIRVKEGHGAYAASKAGILQLTQPSLPLGEWPPLLHPSSPLRESAPSLSSPLSCSFIASFLCGRGAFSFIPSPHRGRGRG